MFSADKACSRFFGAPLPNFMLVSLFSVSKPGALWVARRFLCFSGDTGAVFGFNKNLCPRTLDEACVENGGLSMNDGLASRVLFLFEEMGDFAGDTETFFKIRVTQFNFSWSLRTRFL